MSEILQLITLLFVIIGGVILCYKSRLRLLAVEVFTENSKRQTQEAVNSIKLGVEGFRVINDKFEMFNKEQKEKNKLMCFMDKDKECDFCVNGGDSCPFKKGE